MAPLGYERAILGPVFRDYNVESSMLEVSGRMTTVLVRKLRDTEAAEIAEAAMVLPVVFLFLLGVIWFGRAFNIYATIQQAAQQGAIAAARPTCGTCSTSIPSLSAVDTAASNVIQAANLDLTQIHSSSINCPTSTHNITICQGILLPIANPSQPVACGTPPSIGPTQICGVLVSFKYTFQLSLPYLPGNFSSITLAAQAQSRMEN